MAVRLIQGCQRNSSRSLSLFIPIAEAEFVCATIFRMSSPLEYFSRMAPFTFVTEAMVEIAYTHVMASIFAQTGSYLI